ncbi:Hypothetical protein Ccan_22790 [Capnocytophaga canimorsus Cc5]|uniref:Uncharacterized protein n=1 Tax=Capnocytophaga canimorsus (strain 5) TaxID=860228 RepID=F9YVG0_CAPCC|nr:hypothetical protein [Capnocytophaga canimorsus]AEK24394.1 Hypothetical protein Ccan_22790 [Capnocytophaga canimorsus Cc5]WGU68893.1 hypothetical protein QIU19_02925 [Capnocytophaga canimorsus]WGU70004.1 hypothetical protein QIU18_10730 [Capnocytophaga canimorsus]
MRLKNRILFLIVLFCLSSCKNLQIREKNNQISIIKDSLQNENKHFEKIFIEDLMLHSKNNKVVDMFNSEMLGFLVNSSNIKNPRERLEHKKNVLQNCINTNNYWCEDAVMEQFKILYKTKKYISIEYKYNALRFPNEYYKYATFDLQTGKRISGKQILKNPEEILLKANNKAISGLIPTEDTSAIIMRELLESFEKYTVKDLDNFYFECSGKDKKMKICFYFQGFDKPYQHLYNGTHICYDINLINLEMM